MSDSVLLELDRGDARGVVEILEQAAVTPGQRYPLRVMWIAHCLETLLDEPRPYPELPPSNPPVLPALHLSNRIP